MNSLKHFPSLSNGSTASAFPQVEDEDDQEYEPTPLTPNGRLVKLARLDEDSTQFALNLLRPAGGDELKTIKYKDLICTVPSSICKVFDIEYTEVANVRTSYKQAFERLGVIPILDKEKIPALCDQLGVKRPGNLSLFSLQSVVFLLLGMKKSIAGDILRHGIGISLEKYSTLFDLAAIKVNAASSRPKATPAPVHVIRAVPEAATVLKPVPTPTPSPTTAPAVSSIDVLQSQVEFLIQQRAALTAEIDRKIDGLEYAIEVLKNGF